MMYKRSYLLCLVLAATLLLGSLHDAEGRGSRYRRQSGDTGRVTLYKHEAQEAGNNAGQKITLTLRQGHCVNLDAYWNDDVSSVDPHEACVILYENGFCRGKGIRFYQYSYGTSKLVNVDLNDAVSSLKLC